MFETLKRLCDKGKLTAAALEKAVGLGWITREQKEELLEGIK